VTSDPCLDWYISDDLLALVFPSGQANHNPEQMIFSVTFEAFPSRTAFEVPRNCISTGTSSSPGQQRHILSSSIPVCLPKGTRMRPSDLLVQATRLRRYAPISTTIFDQQREGSPRLRAREQLQRATGLSPISQRLPLDKIGPPTLRIDFFPRLQQDSPQQRRRTPTKKRKTLRRRSIMYNTRRETMKKSRARKPTSICGSCYRVRSETARKTLKEWKKEKISWMASQRGSG
jgi:hypothetical protein